MREKTEGAQPVAHAHEHDTLLREFRAVIRRNAGHAAGEAATVDPDHYCQLFRRRFGGGPYIQVQAVFAHRVRGAEEPGEARVLHAVRAEPICLLLVGPRLHGLRSFPAQICDRRGRERNAFERHDAVCQHTGDLAARNGGTLNLRDGGVRAQKGRRHERRDSRYLHRSPWRRRASKHTLV